ncbi:hypothetical protein GQ42DRAFT_61390, partial [Ramicandelaber brevisporus]
AHLPAVGQLHHHRQHVPHLDDALRRRGQRLRVRQLQHERRAGVDVRRAKAAVCILDKGAANQRARDVARGVAGYHHVLPHRRRQAGHGHVHVLEADAHADVERVAGAKVAVRDHAVPLRDAAVVLRRQRHKQRNRQVQRVRVGVLADRQVDVHAGGALAAEHAGLRHGGAQPVERLRLRRQRDRRRQVAVQLERERNVQVGDALEVVRREPGVPHVVADDRDDVLLGVRHAALHVLHRLHALQRHRDGVDLEHGRRPRLRPQLHVAGDARLGQPGEPDHERRAARGVRRNQPQLVADDAAGVRVDALDLRRRHVG